VDTILADPGGEFTGASLGKLMHRLGITWKLTITDRPSHIGLSCHGLHPLIG